MENELALLHMQPFFLSFPFFFFFWKKTRIHGTADSGDD